MTAGGITGGPCSCGSGLPADWKTDPNGPAMCRVCYRVRTSPAVRAQAKRVVSHTKRVRRARKA